jgi:hypothetical protein
LATWKSIRIWDIHGIEWMAERIGWLPMALLLAAFMGFLGPGPLSSSTAGEKGSSL